MNKKRLLSILLLLLPSVAWGQTNKLIIIQGRTYVDAVKSLGCVQGIGNGSGNAAKINAYLATRPAYPLYLPGGALEIDDTLLIEGAGATGIVGTGQGGPYDDNSYSGAGIGSQPTRLVWVGAADKAMIQVDSRLGSVSNLTLQSRPMSSLEPDNTGVKARIGIHVRTINESGIPSGKQKFRDITFHGLPHGILFGSDLDTSLATVGGYNNADETEFAGLFFQYPYTEGWGSGTLTTRTDADTGVVTLSSSTHGITQGNYCDIEWSGGARTGMLVTGVSGAAVTLDGGYGTDLPAQDTAITSCQEERCCMRFRTSQALGYSVSGIMQVNGHPESVFNFERGGKLWCQHCAVSGWSDATHQQNILKLGGISSGTGFYDIGLHLDATTKCVKWVNCTADVFHKVTINLRAAQSYPSVDETYTVPAVVVRGGCHVNMSDFNRLLDSSILLTGGVGVDGVVRNRPAVCHLERCSTTEDMAWIDEVIDDSSTGPYWVTWRNCEQRWGGEFGDGGYEGWPYDDDEKLVGVARIAAPPPP